MIRVKMTTTKGQLQEMAVAASEDIRKRALAVLARAGEEAVNVARDAALKNGKDWMDRTGNLRSSIGYVICEDGKPVAQSKFEQVKDTATEGREYGLALAYRVGGDTHGYALVVVAGMNYAVYVADKGYDVLSSSQIHAQMRIPELFEKIVRYDEENR